MSSRGALAALTPMAHDDDPIPLVTERFERRLAEERSQLRVEMAVEFGQLRTEMAQGFGELRAVMITRNADFLKWLLVFFAAQTTAIAALLKLFR